MKLGIAGVSGGVTRSIGGGNFLAGFGQGVIVEGFNHLKHGGKDPIFLEEGVMVPNDEGRYHLISWKDFLGIKEAEGVIQGVPEFGPAGSLGMARKIYQARKYLSPQNLRAAKAYYKQALIHIKKLRLYKQNPLQYDNKGHLARNSGNSVIQNKIIKARINHLRTEIQTFHNNFMKLLD